jgi:hypothetical protein
MSEEDDGKVLVFRNHVGQPIAVPGDIVTEAERVYRCHRMRVNGNTWEQIAQLELYPSAGAAKADVDRYIKEGKALVIESSQREMLTLEVARLDAMQLGLWERAVNGNVPAVNAIVNIIAHRARLVGLDANQLNEEHKGPHTLVVPMDGPGFLEALKDAAAKSKPLHEERNDDSTEEPV